MSSKNLHTKPEPLVARPNWHYDSYYLSQLQRLNLLNPEHSNPSLERLKSIAQRSEINAHQQLATRICEQAESKLLAQKEAMERINQLAASIGVTVKFHDFPHTSNTSQSLKKTDRFCTV